MTVSIKPEENLPYNPERSVRSYHISGDELGRLQQLDTAVKLSDAVEYSVKIFKSIAEDRYREREKESR